MSGSSPASSAPLGAVDLTEAYAKPRLRRVPREFDFLVIGSGPAGQRAAIQAAKLGRHVGIVERRHMVGGVCTNTGTIPSKKLREAVLYLTGLNQREIYSDSYRVKADLTIRDLEERTNRVIAREIDVIRNQLQRNRVELITGETRFLDPHMLEVALDGGGELQPTADQIVVAVGTRPARPPRGGLRRADGDRLRRAAGSCGRSPRRSSSSGPA